MGMHIWEVMVFKWQRLRRYLLPTEMSQLWMKMRMTQNWPGAMLVDHISSWKASPGWTTLPSKRPSPCGLTKPFVLAHVRCSKDLHLSICISMNVLQEEGHSCWTKIVLRKGCPEEEKERKEETNIIVRKTVGEHRRNAFETSLLPTWWSSR